MVGFNGWILSEVNGDSRTDTVVDPTPVPDDAVIVAEPVPTACARPD